MSAAAQWTPVADTTAWKPVAGAPSAPLKPPAPKDAGFFSTLGSDIVSGAKKLYNIPAEVASGRAIDDLTQMGTALTQGRKDAWQQAKDAYAKGNYKEAAEHALGAIPIVGPPVNAAMNEMRQPDAGQPTDATHQGMSGSGMAHAVEALAPFVAPEVAAAAKWVPIGPVARAVVAGTKAAAPDVAAGLAKVGVGEVVAGAIPGMDWPGRIVFGYPGLRQVAAGFKTGAGAAREAFAGPPAIPELPSGFGVAGGSTAAPAVAVDPLAARLASLRQPGYQPSPEGALPGATFPAAPPAPAVPGFNAASGSTAAPIPAARPVAPGYQPPISGALPGLSDPLPSPSAIIPHAAPPVGPYEQAAIARQAQGDGAAEVAPVEDALLLDEISHALAGKPFKTLSADKQAIVRKVASAPQPEAAPSNGWKPEQARAFTEQNVAPPGGKTAVEQLRDEVAAQATPKAAGVKSKGMELYRSNANSEIGEDGHWATPSIEYAQRVGDGSGEIQKLNLPDESRVIDLGISKGYTPADAIKAMRSVFPRATEKQLASLIDPDQWEGDGQHYDIPDLIHSTEEQPNALLSSLAKEHGYDAIRFQEGIPGSDMAHEGRVQKGRVPTYFIAGGKSLTDAQKLAPMMQDISPAMRKRVADSNYIAVKNGDTPAATAGPAYEAAGRANKVDAVATKNLSDMADGVGVSHSALAKMQAENPAHFRQVIQDMAKSAGQNPLSDVSIEHFMELMKQKGK